MIRSGAAKRLWVEAAKLGVRVAGPRNFMVKCDDSAVEDGNILEAIVESLTESKTYVSASAGNIRKY
jgi:hypothetical protein